MRWFHRGLAAAVTAAPLAGAAASTITIPWTVDLALNSGSGPSQIDAFDASHTIGKAFTADALLASMQINPGVRFGSEFTSDYRVRLPFSITLSTPDRARPGSVVRVTPTITLNGAPRFEADGRASFDTSFFVKGYVDTAVTSKKTFDTGLIQLPDIVPVTQSSYLQFGGNGTYQEVDTTATAVASGAFARTVPDFPVITGSLGGAPLGSPNPDIRYPGYQLSTTGRIQGWNANVNLLDIAEKIPVIGGAAAIANTVIDLDLQAGINLVEESTLSTGLLYGFYTVPGLNQIGVIELNSPASLNSFEVRIPTTAQNRFELEFYGLGLGLGLIQEYLYEPSIKLILDAIDPLGSWKLLEARPGDPWDIGKQYTRFNYLDCITEIAACTADGTQGVARQDRTLAWAIDNNAPTAPPPPPYTLDLPPTIVTAFDGQVPGQTDSGLFPGTAPIGEPTLIPEPRSAEMLALALLLLPVCLTRRRMRHTRRHASGSSAGSDVTSLANAA